MGKTIMIKTKRLILVPKTAKDLQQTIDEEKDPGMKMAYQEMLAGVQEHEKDWLWYTLWSVQLKTKEEIGGVCFKGAPDDCGEVEIGYGINEEYRHNHYAFEAVNHLVNWALSKEKVYFIMAETAPDNQISMHLLEKLGFKPAGYSGEEGPVFEKEKEKTNFTSTYMCLGISIGMCFGMCVMNNMTTGMALGVGLGSLLGLGLDKADQKKRQQLYEKRKDKRQE